MFVQSSAASLLVVALAASAASVRAQEASVPRLMVEEVVLGEARPDTSDRSFSVSPDGERYAYLACHSSVWRGMVNNLSLGRGMNAGKCEVVVDGSLFGPYGGATRASFSSDNKRFAFAAMPNTRYRDETFMVVIDGVEGEEVEGMLGPLVFSRDGKHVAHAADVDGGRVFVDGQPGPSFDFVYTDQSFFCGENADIVYGAKTDDGWALVVDGQVRADTFADEMGAVQCMSDGTTFYSFKHKKERFVAARGEPEGPYEDVRWLTLSDDGAHYSYIAKLGKKREVVVVDGEPGAEYEEVQGTVMGSADQIGVAVKHRKRRTFIVNGQDTGEWKELMGGRFSPDGEHFAFLGKRQKQVVLWRDGVETPIDQDVLGFDFSPRGRSLLMVVQAKEGLRVVIDDVESDAFPEEEGSIGMFPHWIDDSSAVAYARKNRQIVRRTFRVQRQRPGRT